MKEQLITYSTAKLGKERGFDWKVRYSFGHTINPHIAYPNEDYAISCDFNSPNIGRNWEHLYSAPTQSLLQKWLREVHRVYIEIQVGDAEEKAFWNWKIFTHRDSGRGLIWIKADSNGEIFKTYEEALEQSLREALRLIDDEK